MIHFVGYTQNHLPVHVDLVKSEAAKHIARQPHLLTLAAEALQYVSLDKSHISLEYDLERIVGYDFVVKTTVTDTIFYAQLLHEKTYTRFTKNGKPLPTTYVSILLQRRKNGTLYSMQDIWLGRLIPPRPGSGKETPESEAYWEKHALVFDNQLIQPHTLTKTRPY